MEPRARAKFNTQIYAEACEWFVECRAGDIGDSARRELDRWLRKSPEHLSTYLEIAAIWNEGSSLDPTNKWDADTLIAQAKADHNVVAMSDVALNNGVSSGVNGHSGSSDNEESSTRNRLGTRRWRLAAVAASIAICSVGVGMLLVAQLFPVPTFATAVGEQRSIVLADGSTVELNTRSTVKVRYSEHERAVELVEGQALFHVTKDHARPFVVSSGAARVRAVGTQFDMYKKRDNTVISVVEGRVAILDEAALFLSAGEQLTVTPKTVEKAAHPNVAGATAWRQRQLVFESASLIEVAEEFNRYNERQLIVDNSELYDFHISGVFSSTDPSSLIRFLRAYPGVLVTETVSAIRVAKDNGQ